MPVATARSKKGAQSRQRIVDAALDIVGRDGLSNLSMRSVAAEAGVPLGAMTYYFAGKQQLIDEAFAAHSKRELERVVSTISSIGDAGSPADLALVITAFLVDGLQNPANTLIAEYEFLIEATKQKELARATSAWQQSLQEQLTQRLERLGSRDARVDARLVMAAMAGLEVDNLTREPLSPDRVRAIQTSMSRLFEALSLTWNQPAHDGTPRTEKEAGTP